MLKLWDCPGPWGPAGPCSPPERRGAPAVWTGSGAALPEHPRSVPSPQTVTRRAKVAPARKMSRFLKHFTVVGDDYHAWNVNYKKWENEEEEEEEEQEEQPPAPASAEEGRAAEPAGAPDSAPRHPREFRATLRKLFSSHRFQVGGQRPATPGVGQSRQLRVTRPGGGRLCQRLIHCAGVPRALTTCQAPGYTGQVPCCQGLSHDPKARHLMSR